MASVQLANSVDAVHSLCSQQGEDAAAVDTGAVLPSTAWVDVLRDNTCGEQHPDRAEDEALGSHGIPLAMLHKVLRYLCDDPFERDVDPRTRRNIVVRAAALNGDVDVVRYMCELPLDRGVDPSADNNYAIREAARLGYVDVVRYLCELPLDRGVDPSAVNNDAIRAAAKCGHVEPV